MAAERPDWLLRDDLRGLVTELRQRCLGLRAWSRSVYAEIGTVLLDPDGLRLEGRMVGAEPANPVLELRSTATRELPGSVTDAGFAVRIGALPAGTWQLWPRYTPGRPAVRLGRLLDDVARKDIACVLPPIVTEGVTM